MNGHVVLVTSRTYLHIDNPSRWRSGWYTVEGGTNPTRFAAKARPRAVVVVGPFEAGKLVSYEGSRHLKFRFIDLPGEP